MNPKQLAFALTAALPSVALAFSPNTPRPAHTQLHYRSYDDAVVDASVWQDVDGDRVSLASLAEPSSRLLPTMPSPTDDAPRRPSATPAIAIQDADGDMTSLSSLVERPAKAAVVVHGANDYF
ncbi:hypothetical protein ACHAXT_004242 [Thalassiosira profunda]